MNILTSNHDTSESKSENDALSEWDRAVVLVFIFLISCMSLYYWFFWGDIWVPLLGLTSMVILYTGGLSDQAELYKPLRKLRNPLLEGSIVFLIFFDWILFIAPLIIDGILQMIIGSIVFGFIIPYIFLITYLGYPRKSLGLNEPKKGMNSSVIVVCSVLLLPILVRLFLSSDAHSTFFTPTVILTFLIGVIYLGFTVGFVEEFVFRGILQNRISLHLRSRVLGLIITSSIFATMHVFAVMSGLEITPVNVGSSLLFAFMTRLPLGIILGIVWNESENILGVTLIHAINNIAFLVALLSGL